MKKIASNKQVTTTKTTRSARGIILKEGHILLTYSTQFEDYTTPGGRVEGLELLEETLKRELQEEVGIEVVAFEPLGYIDEYYKSGNSYELKKHYYYLILKYRMGEKSLRSDEINYGMESRWVLPKEAITQNEEQINKRLKKGLHPDDPFITTMKRENSILQYIKEHYL